MVKIIKRGIAPQERVAHWHCLGCRSVMESYQAEGKLVRDQRDGDAVMFVCPVCQRENWVSLGAFTKIPTDGIDA